jgi:hypothetical protein
LTKIQAKFTKYPPVATQPGRYTIQQVKEHQTRYGPTLILTIANSKGDRFSLFVSCPEQISDKSLLARLTRAFSDETDQWVGGKIELTLDRNRRRRVDPVTR